MYVDVDWVIRSHHDRTKQKHPLTELAAMQRFLPDVDSPLMADFPPFCR